MSFLDREAIVAEPSYSRWMFPPAAIAVQMCIGEVYGFSVFNKPLGQLIGIAKPDPARGDWSQTQIIQIYSIALVMLGLSAAIFGKWVERSGPRKTMVASALCFCGGLWISALGVYFHNIWLIYLGYGFIGGIGLGLGYIAPVSTLIKWFPDRPGMATGFAIMGFGSGALIGSPLGQLLMDKFKTAQSVGVGEAFLVMGALYIFSMLFGAWIARVPAEGWKPAGWTPPTERINPMITQHHVSADEAIKTPQFWLLWIVLCMNVSAGIGILGQYSPMIQAMFGVPAAVAAGFGGLLSIFNMGGRFIWSSTSDYTGRRIIYLIYFLLGIALYCTIPYTQKTGGVLFFVVLCCVIISMYGGGFATIPAYLRDMFGTYQVGAIHGRLITAWSVAAVIGPNLITGISEYKRKQGMPAAISYNDTMYICAGLLLVGCVCNLLVRPVHSKHHHAGSDLLGASGKSATPAVASGSRV
ncbi:MAG: OFA family MFS transporter [Verrucomicrobia bacterium]|nr:OFA family MFS transporter [Verrucomicrobiota bacterium]